MPNPVPSSAFATLAKPEPEIRRSHLPALLLLVVMVLAAASVLAIMRPDLIKSEWIHKEMLDPAREKAMRWLHLSEQKSPPAPAVLAALPAPAPLAPAVPAPVTAAAPLAATIPAALVTPEPKPTPAQAQAEAPASADPAPVTAAVPPPAAPAPAPEAQAVFSNAASSDAASSDAPPAATVENTQTPDPKSSAAGIPAIVLGAKADVWLRVRNDSGQTLLERILHKGETWKVTDQRGLRLSTGNAGDTIVSIDGVTWPSLGSTGGVQHDLPLDAALLSIALLQTRKTKRPANERPVNTKALPAAAKPTAAASR